MKLRKLIIILISLSFATQASAGMIVWFSDGFGTTDGGELTAHVATGSDPIGPLWDPGDTFGTFCIERDEHVTLQSRKYWVELNTEAVKGGNNTDTGDPLDYRSAWIYTQWMTQSSFTINKTGGGTLTIEHNDAGANIVQWALWTIEEEADYTSYAGVQDLIDAAAAANWKNLGNVRVMNLYQLADDGTHTVFSQDMMVMVPVPATILLGFLGLSVGGWKLRKSL